MRAFQSVARKVANELNMDNLQREMQAKDGPAAAQHPRASSAAINPAKLEEHPLLGGAGGPQSSAQAAEAALAADLRSAGLAFDEALRYGEDSHASVAVDRPPRPLGRASAAASVPATATAASGSGNPYGSSHNGSRRQSVFPGDAFFNQLPSYLTPSTLSDAMSRTAGMVAGAAATALGKLDRVARDVPLAGAGAGAGGGGGSSGSASDVGGATASRASAGAGAGQTPGFLSLSTWSSRLRPPTQMQAQTANDRSVLATLQQAALPAYDHTGMLVDPPPPISFASPAATASRGLNPALLSRGSGGSSSSGSSGGSGGSSGGGLSLATLSTAPQQLWQLLSAPAGSSSNPARRWATLLGVATVAVFLYLLYQRLTAVSELPPSQPPPQLPQVPAIGGR